MARHACECGEAWSMGKNPAPACAVCKKCGTTIDRKGEAHRKAVPHISVVYTNVSTGEKKTICDVCGFRF